MILKSLFIAFSMYSRIPVPKTQWNEDSMKYVFCFFPLVGAVIGFAVWIIGKIMIGVKCGNVLFGAVMSAIPVFITGGIHFDGFLDTLDAIHCYGDKEKRLKVLKDPAAGAFAVIGAVLYFAFSTGLWSEIYMTNFNVMPFCYVLSRAFCGIGAVLFPPAKKEGLAALFGENADKLKVTLVMAAFIALDLTLIIFIDMTAGIIIFLSAALCFLYHYFNCIKKFGGITGDLSGYFLQVLELVFLIDVYARGRFM